MRIPWRPAQSAEPEWMDLPGHSAAVIADNLRDLERVNRLLGGVRLTLRPLARLLSGRPVQEPVRILDVASGGADIARAIAGWARDQGRAVAIVASDISYDFLLVARDRSPHL
jgi:ubiquinone/menaquinone biosynthesis C-methylase UbiE